MLLKTLAYEQQDTLLPSKWEIEHIGNKLPFEKKLNIVAGNGYFAKKKKRVCGFQDCNYKRNGYICCLGLEYGFDYET